MTLRHDQKLAGFRMIDARISAAKHAFLAILLAASAFVYLSIGEIDRVNNLEKKRVLSFLLAVRDISAGRYKPIKLKDSDLPRFSDRLEDEFRKIYMDILRSRADKSEEKRFNYSYEKMDERFGDSESDIGYVVRDIPLPYSAIKKCDAILIRPNDYFFFNSFNMVFFSGFGEVYSRNVRYVTFDNRCEDVRQSRFYAFIIPDENGVISIALPDSVLKIFPELDFFIKNDIMTFDHEKAAALIPKKVASYFPELGPMMSLDIRAIEVLTINMLGHIDGKSYSVSELSNSLINIYDRENEKTSLAGVILNSRDFLRIVPGWMLIVTIYYWRQLRALAKIDLKGKVWTPLDTNDIFGLCVAYAWALCPLILTALVYFMYPSVFQTILVLFGREISPMGIVMGQFPRAVGPGWYGLDFVAAATLWLLILHVAAVVACVTAGLKIVRRNRLMSFSRALRLLCLNRRLSLWRG